ncbi:exportin-2 [Tanacetum coccineum]
MEWNQMPLEFLSHCFCDTLSPHPEPRRRAEINLLEATDSVNYGLSVLRLVLEPSVDEVIMSMRRFLFADRKIEVQLSEALVVIGNHDFPESWPALLPELKSES